MSLITLLAIGADNTPPTPPPPGATPGIPPTADPTLSMMRPSIAPLATIPVGPARTHHDLWAAKAYGDNIRSAWLASDGATGITASHPKYRVTYLLDPGTYTTPTGDIALSISEANVYAADPTPGATVIHAGLDGCSNLYWEGVDILRVANGTWEPKYAAHVQSSGTTIFANCKLDSLGGGGGGSWVGQDAQDHVSLTFYGVIAGVDSSGAGDTNLHGPTSAPVVLNLVGMTTRGPVKWTLNGGQETDLWIVGSTVGGITASGETEATKPNLHMLSSTLTGPNYWDGDVDASGAWPVPVGGLSPYWRSQLGL